VNCIQVHRLKREEREEREEREQREEREERRKAVNSRDICQFLPCIDWVATWVATIITHTTKHKRKMNVLSQSTRGLSAALVVLS
jgi:hypothetical protein